MPSLEALECRAMLAAGVIQFSAAAFGVVDSAGTVPIVMTRTGGSTGAVSVKLATSDGTAISGTDYTAVTGSIGFPDGVTTETLKLSILLDPVANLPGRTVNLTLSNPLGGATLGTTSAAVLTITHVAVAGDLDGTFGTNGQLVVPAGPANLPSGATAYPLGPFLIAADGSSYGISELNGASATVYVNKFKPDGTPDISFGTNGVASVDLGSNGFSPVLTKQDSTFQPDGKIIIAGFNDPSHNLVMVRLNTDGSPDATFGQNGVALFSTSTNQSGGIAVLTGGQIVVGLPFYAANGSATTGFDVAAFASDGSPLITFGTSGLVALAPVSQSGAANIADVGQILAMPDGTFVVGDTLGSVPSNDLQLALLRYNSDGTLDQAFGSGGLALGPAYAYGSRIRLAPNGDIVQLGAIPYAGGTMIAAYLPSGALDPSFGNSGEVQTSATSIGFQPNGQIVGVSNNSPGAQIPTSIVLTRLNSNGSLDTNFGQGGSTTTPPYHGGYSGLSAVAFVAGGSILVAGNTNQPAGTEFELERYIAPQSLLTPTITWPDPADITVGTPLSAVQLDATASVAGVFTYTPPTGTVLGVGASQSLALTFTPTDTTDYTSATDTVQINVNNLNRATPTITWANPAAIIAGTLLSAAQLDATASVAGVFSYLPAAGTALGVGTNESLSVVFSPTDTADYTSATDTVHINVNHPSLAIPPLYWPNPADIAVGTPLSAVQLDAFAFVPGIYTYTPAMGTILSAGANQSLTVTFTPADTTKYTTVTDTVHINVLNIILTTPTITWSKPADITAGMALGTAQLDATASVPGRFTYTPAAGAVLGAGANQPLAVTFTPLDTTHYTSATASVLINVNPATSAPTPPHVLGIVSVTRTKKGLTAITLGFDEPLVQASAVNRALYHVFGAVTKKKKTVYTKSVGAIKGISFDGNTRVTITLAKPYKGVVQMTVLGVLTAANGATNSVHFMEVV